MLGAFAFALLGPFYLYVAWLNSIVVDDPAQHARMLPLAPAALIWLTLLLVAFFAGNWRDYRQRGRHERAARG